MPRRKFFDRSVVSNKVFSVQVPCERDIKGMHSLPAGYDEDQRLRIDLMVQTVKFNLEQYRCIETEIPDLLNNWTAIFQAIKDGKEEEAVQLFNELAGKNDLIYQSLLAVHERTYLIEIIRNCATKSQLKAKKPRLEGNPDVVLNDDTFEILLKDLATTLSHRSKLYFSFGLPTHHAFSHTGAGFCSLNKTAVMISAIQREHQEKEGDMPLHHLVVGIDVNRDDGLSEILRSKLSMNHILHIDIYDSEVYPYQNFSDFKTKFSDTCEGEIDNGKQENYQYVSIDLLKNQREPTDDIHPAIIKAIERIKAHFAASNKDEKFVIYVPMGWDSHQEELADCSKMLHAQDKHRKMKGPEAIKRRFNDADFDYFNKQLVDLYNKYSNNLVIYWGLEGGYTNECFQRLIIKTLSKIDEVLSNSDQPDPSVSLSA